MSSPLNVHLEQYDGPLDLLLDLIRRQEIDIYDIPIAKITAQYLTFIERATELNVELGSEFVYMAATLIHIKSKLLLPRDPALVEAGVEDEDPRTELVQRLLEHERFKNAAEMLQQKRLIEEAVWSNPQVHEFLSEDNSPDLAVTIFDLVKTFQTILDRTKNRPLYQVDQEEVTVPDMIRYLKSRLKELPADGKISVTALFERQRTRRAMICLFLALLEMVRMQALAVLQKDSFGEINIHRHSGFERALDTDESMAAIEQGYS